MSDDITENAEQYGLSFNESDSKWYRLAGWGEPDNWETEPKVFVPTDHAVAILAHDRLAGDIVKLQAEIERLHLDEKRLDWLEEHQVRVDDPTWCFRQNCRTGYLVLHETSHRAWTEFTKYDSPRKAIDAVMKDGFGEYESDQVVFLDDCVIEAAEKGLDP